MGRLEDRALELFAEVCDLSPEAQARRLEEIGREDPVLRSDVEELLEGDRLTDGRLDEKAPVPPSLLPVDRGEDQADEALRIVERLVSRTRPFEHYRIEGEVGRGGMGKVLEVWDEDLDRRLAMKVIVEDGPPVNPGAAASDSRAMTRFLDEARVTGQLDHPGIVPVHELGLDSDGRVYFTMKLVRGRTLHEVFDQVAKGEEGWSRTRALGVLLKVCEAMAYAHSKDVVHRDLKPANVMVGRFGEVYVMDWGVARIRRNKDLRDLRPKRVPGSADETGVLALESPVVTMDGTVVGTPYYMPPEQAAGRMAEVDARSDVYALGAMLYHLLAGRPPYAEPDRQLSPHAVLARVLAAPPRPLQTLARDAPAEICAICEKAMARKPEDRYVDTSALAEDLRAYLEHRVVRAYETGAFAELRKWVERNRGLAAASAAGMLAVVAGLVASLVLKAQADRNAKLAGENEQRALAGETLAKQERERANREAEAATKKADEVLRLSAFQRLVDLEAEADRLWPADPENVPKYDSWLERAHELVAGLDPHGDQPGHRAQLAKLRERAVPMKEEEREAKRRAHPRFGELEELAKKVAALRVAQEVREGKAQPAAFPLNASLLPTDADGLNGLARPLVDPVRTELGREAEGLALARLAIEKVEDDESAARAGDTLAWALFANGLDEEALQESAAALEAAPSERRSEYDDQGAELRKAVEAARSGSTLSTAESELAELQAEISSAEAYHFADEQDTWWHNQLQKLVAEVEAFADPKSGLIAGISPEHGSGIEQRRGFAATVGERSVTGEAARRLWSVAVASIGDPKECPKYGGLRIAPQLGLLPIGPDPDSGLWEFAHLQTGDSAVRGANGKLMLTEGMGMVFVLLPGGAFQMGAQNKDPFQPSYDPQAQPDESPVREVTLSPFFLSKYELTQGQWLRFTGRNPSSYGPRSHGRSWSRTRRVADLLHPVEGVSWTVCRETCINLGLILPSEAQWEYGARAGKETPWWTGEDPKDLASAGNVADAWARTHGAPSEWNCEAWDDGNTVHAAIGSYRANPFGLNDVIGNVWEWCEDKYNSSTRANRGGSFNSAAEHARSARRYNAPPGFFGDDLGLRPARTLAP